MCLAQHHLLFTRHDTMADIGQSAATYANGMNLGDIVSDGTQLRHGAEGLSLEVEIQACYDNAYTPVGQLVADIYDLRVKELCFIDAQNIAVRSHEEDAGSALYGC